MNTGLLPVRYARAILDLAEEKNKADEIYLIMMHLSSNFELCPELNDALDNPVVFIENKKKLILAAALNPEEPIFESFVDLVLHNKRENLMRRIALATVELYRKRKKIICGRLTTAVTIDKTVEDKIKKMIQLTIDKNIEFETHVDKHLIGGFILDLDGERMDASIARRFREIRKKITK